jgi:2-polyprenyl-6-methoxyphenol hydroxylase-like FAD-dependent oxidoreductase
MSKKIIIIGGGPIGLIHAFAFKKLNPELDVIVFEKYKEYQRKHTLALSPSVLTELFEVTQTTEVPDFKSLLKKLNKNGNIRTIDLQTTFTNYANELGVKIIYREMKPDDIKEQILEQFPDASLIIGADGTHSIISKMFFSERKDTDTNQINYPLDFMLQLRIEIKGKSDGINLHTERAALILRMGRQGLIANEIIGRYDEKSDSTPVSLQIFISEEQHSKLKEYTAKLPFKPYSDDKKANIPKKIDGFIQEYIKLSIDKCSENNLEVDKSSISISVNETPASQAKDIVTLFEEKTPILLAGDARLSASYQLGLGAGVKSTTEFFKRMKSSITSDFNDKKLLLKTLFNYETWFLDVFAPQILKQTFQFSALVIRPAIFSFGFSAHVKELSSTNDDYEKGPTIRDYFDYTSSSDQKVNPNWRYFPHRTFEPVSVAQWSYIPPLYTFYKILMLTVECFKPYQSGTQYLYDIIQPVRAIMQVHVGLGKTIAGLFTLNGYQFLDGISMLLRGLIELFTTPLAWFVKPITRGIITAMVGAQNIEENTFMQYLVRLGEYRLTRKDVLTDPKQRYEVLAVCNDLHRKFNKSQKYGQKTQIRDKESLQYELIRTNIKQLKPEYLTEYFSLFKAEKKIEVEHIVENKELTFN